MTVQAAQIVRLCIAGVLAAFPFCTAPPACGGHAAGCGRFDAAQAGPAAPPRPTEQQERCVAAPPADAGTADPGQLKGLNLQDVWRLTRGAGQTVAVIDTGVARHRLLPRLVPGGDYVYTADGTDDCDGHGTVVAGIIGAEPDSDGSAFSGIAPNTTILEHPTVQQQVSGIGRSVRIRLRRCRYACDAPSAPLRTWVRR